MHRSSRFEPFGSRHEHFLLINALHGGLVSTSMSMACLVSVPHAMTPHGDGILVGSTRCAAQTVGIASLCASSSSKAVPMAPLGVVLESGGVDG